MKEIVCAEMEISKDRCVDIDAFVHYHVEIYGQDSDGNRGEKRTIVDNVTHINAWDDEKKEIVKLSDDQLELAEDLIIRRFLES